MADQDNSKMDVQLLKRTRISVFVDEALPDILVVSYEYGVKIFKGVLLDSTKRNLPCGIATLNPAFNIQPPKTNPDDDVLYSVNQRYAYTDPNNAKKKNVQIAKYKNSKMTVRLRPRQVLCSKCKGICNENSENVSKKRKSTENVHPPPPIKRGANAPITRSVYSELNSKKKESLELKPSLIPKISRLMPQEISNALSGNVNKLNIIDSNVNKKPLAAVSNVNSKCGSTINSDVDSENKELGKNVNQSSHSTDYSELNSNTNEKQGQQQEICTTQKGADFPGKSVKRVLRKKRSIGSMEDLWDESVFEENANNKNNISSNNSAGTDQSLNANSVCLSTRTIKISYGPQGEGTVLKIPAQIDNLAESDDSEENINVDEQKSKNKNVNNKAARRALKRAKKEARRKILLSGNSPCYIGNGSPRYLMGGSSPRYTIGSASPRHGLGNNSPRYVAVSAYEINAPRRRKHKMKHKKKHREDKDRKHKEGEVSSTQEECAKEQCLTQKLSINLKRLNDTYTSCQTAPDSKAEENHSSSDEHSEQVPNFPPPNPPLMLRINAQTLSSASGADGRKLFVGDVVWGKIHGFPWWPGKILTMTNVGTQGPQAHVAWYGSSTSSLMQCDQLSPYLENFKTRYNKKKRGPYKEAIKQATTEARQNAETKIKDTLVSSSPARSIITVVPPALASPREIDVVS